MTPLWCHHHPHNNPHPIRFLGGLKESELHTLDWIPIVSHAL
jgi:hypothetical protein